MGSQSLPPRVTREPPHCTQGLFRSHTITLAVTAVTPRSRTGQIAARQPIFWAAAGQRHRQLLSAPRCKQLLHLLLQEGGNKRDAARGQDEEQDSELQEGGKKKKETELYSHTLRGLGPPRLDQTVASPSLPQRDGAAGHTDRAPQGGRSALG